MKNKFSRIVEVNLENSEKQEKIKQKFPKRAKQPNQQKLFQKGRNQKIISDGNIVKSQVESRKNIMKVATDLKKKLKHNYNSSKDRMIQDENKNEGGEKVESMKQLSKIGKKKHAFVVEGVSPMKYETNFQEGKKQIAVTTINNYGSNQDIRVPRNYSYRKYLATKK